MSVLTILPLLAVAAHPVWFGPASVAFDYKAPGNPYDAEANDMTVQFSGPGGRVERRLAYFDDGKWKAWLMAPAKGKYVGRLFRNGVAVTVASEAAEVDTPVARGFVRKGPGQSFVFDDGERYWPLGHNLAWYSPERMPAFPTALEQMSRQGVNWTRIWACTWDGKNPWWPNEKQTVPIGELWSPALKQWDRIVQAADRTGIRFQFVLFHHGEFASTTDSNWADNPWNSKNGGFLSDPVEFFTNSRAKRLSRNWLRYAVARYGHSPSVMAWELFNEVQWVDAVKNGHVDDVAQWHEEMARYLKSIDPYRHLVVTSSDLSLPIWKSMDFYSPHGYPQSVASMVLATDLPKDKPLFYGEVGPGELGGDKEIQLRAIRDGIWSGLLGLQAGAAQYWTWDAVYSYGLQSEYQLADRLIRLTGVLKENGLRRIEPKIDAGQGGILTLAPGGGWESTRKLEYDLPRDADQLGKLSSYFQGTGHSEMRSGPVVFRFRAPKAGVLSVRMVGMSQSGARLVIVINGSKAAERTWAAVAKPESIEVAFPAGEVVATLDNDGPDWFQLGAIRISGVAPRVTAVAIGNGKMLLARVLRTDSEQPPTATVTNLNLQDGSYEANLTDLDTGRTRMWRSKIEKGVLVGGLPISEQDSILYLRRK